MSSRRKCWVPTCLNPNLDCEKGYFPLPEDAEMTEVWLALSGKSAENITTKIIFCQDHFTAQDIVKLKEKKQHHITPKIHPINYMPDRMCGTCMSLIPPEQTFHIVSSKFPSEMPPTVKEILNFMVPSKPEPLHQIFTFCMKELKLSRDPPPIVCNDCYTNAWVYFVFQMTCIDVEKNLKANMSWENYGKKVLCRCCPQAMGTNFITLSNGLGIANLLQNMFIGECPPPGIVPLQVCITCYNVLQRIEKFYKNCLEVGEKMKRHLALQKKYFQLPDSEIPSSSTVPTSSRSPQSEVTPPKKQDSEIKLEDTGSSKSSKLLLAQIMLKYGQPLKTDLYQEDVWSVICDKMQLKGVSCNVPGLMNFWKEMVIEAKTKFNRRQFMSLTDDLVLKFGESKNSKKEPSTIVTTSEVPMQDKQKIPESDSDTEIPVLEDERLPIASPRKNNRKPLDLPNKISAWSDDDKLNFLKIFEKEYIQYITRTGDLGKRRPWKVVCTRIVASGYYTINDDNFFHRLWMNMKCNAEEDSQKSKPCLLSGKVSFFLRRDILLCNGKPIPLTNEEKTHLIKLLDKHMHRTQERWPFLPDYWDAVARDFYKINPLHNLESIKRGFKNLRIKLRSRIDGPHDEIDKLLIQFFEKYPAVQANYCLKIEKATCSGGKEGAGSSKTDSKPQSTVLKLTNHSTKKAKLVSDITKIYDSYSKQKIIKLRRSIWTTITRELVSKGVGNFNVIYNTWRHLRMASVLQKNASSPMHVRVRNLMKKHEQIVNDARNQPKSNVSVEQKKHEQKVETRKRHNNKIESTDSSKRIKHAVTDEDEVFRKLLPKQHDEILALLATTHERLLRTNEHQDLRWENVIDEIYDSGGYEDISHEDFVYLFNRLRSEYSSHESAGTLTDLDVKLGRLLKKAASDRQARQLKKKKTTGRYEKDLSFSLSHKYAASTKESEKTEGGAGVEAPKKRRSTTRSLFNLEDYYDSDFCEEEGENPPPSSSSKSWSREERLAFIATVIKHVDVFKEGYSTPAWKAIDADFQSQGYHRSLLGIKCQWRKFAQSAQKVWRDKTEPTEIQAIIIDFMKSTTKESKDNDAEDKEEVDASDNDSDSSDVIDLTYDYVSFDDIERLSMLRSDEDKCVKFENKDGHSCADDSRTDENTFLDYTITKVEGVIDYDMIGEMESNFVTAEDIELGNSEILKTEEEDQNIEENRSNGITSSECR